MVFHRIAWEQAQAAPKAALEANGTVPLLHAGGVLWQGAFGAGKTCCQFYWYVFLLFCNIINYTQY